MKPCRPCRHPKRAELDELLVAGTSLRDVARQFPGLSKSALNRHMPHISKALVKVEEARQAAEAESLFEKVKALEADVHRLRRKAEREGDLRAALVACDRAIDLVKLYGAVKPELTAPADLANELKSALAAVRARRGAERWSDFVEGIQNLSDDQLDAALIASGCPREVVERLGARVTVEDRPIRSHVEAEPAEPEPAPPPAAPPKSPAPETEPSLESLGIRRIGPKEWEL